MNNFDWGKTFGRFFISFIINDDFFVACLDLGDAEMRGSSDGAVNMIKILQHRLQALHIHDNDLLHDSHQIPFSMNIDFKAMTDALCEIGYKGYLTLEADAYLHNHTAENTFEGVCDLALSAKRLREMMPNCKTAE